jgi:hypothetical protein
VKPVTNNSRFWIGWLDLLTPSCTISLNHNQSSVENSLHSLSPVPILLQLQNCTARSHVSFLYNFEDRICHHLQQFLCYCVLIRCCGNVSSAPLLSNGYLSTVESVTSGIRSPRCCLAVVICVTLWRIVSSSVIKYIHYDKIYLPDLIYCKIVINYLDKYYEIWKFLQSEKCLGPSVCMKALFCYGKQFSWDIGDQC